MFKSYTPERHHPDYLRESRGYANKLTRLCMNCGGSWGRSHCGDDCLQSDEIKYFLYKNIDKRITVL